MKETLLVSDITPDIYVETHNDYEVFILRQGEDSVVMTSGQLAQLVGVVQGSRPTKRSLDECPQCHAKPAYTDQQTYHNICSQCGTRQ